MVEVKAMLILDNVHAQQGHHYIIGNDEKIRLPHGPNNVSKQ